MQQPIYLIGLSEPSPELWKVIEQIGSGGRHHFVNKTTALIAPEKPTDTGEISALLGLTGEGPIFGLVLFLNNPLKIRDDRLDEFIRRWH